MYGVSDLGTDAKNDIMLMPDIAKDSNAAKLSRAGTILSALQPSGNGSLAQAASNLTHNTDNGNKYYISGVEISDERANSMTVKQLAQSLSALSVYNNTRN